MFIQCVEWCFVKTVLVTLFPPHKKKFEYFESFLCFEIFQVLQHSGKHWFPSLKKLIRWCLYVVADMYVSPRVCTCDVPFNGQGKKGRRGLSRAELVSSQVACLGLMHSVSPVAHSHCIKLIQHTPTDWHTEAFFPRANLRTIFLYFLRSQCPLRWWCVHGTRSLLRAAPWPSSVGPRETLRQLSFGKRKAAR